MKQTKLHPNNLYQGQYDFEKLLQDTPQLKAFIHINKYGNTSIDFFNPDAVKTLNKALLKTYYNIDFWDIPQGYLCPPIPGRADYIHHINSFLNQYKKGKKKITVLDIGTGANCIYPILGQQLYQWQFVGTDISPIAIQNANLIIENNPTLKNKIALRQQTDKKAIFKNIIQQKEYFDITICNPPFHSSKTEAQKGTNRKLKNLTGQKINKNTLNFGGQHNELWCKGGEVQFIKNMIKESQQFATQCFCFSTLVSKQTTLKDIYPLLKKANATILKTIEMGQGNKVSRIVIWSFLQAKQIDMWVKMRW